MKKILARIGLGLVALIAVGFTGVYTGSYVRLHHKHAVDPALLTLNAVGDTARGRELANIGGCTSCHGPNLAGTVMADDRMFGRLVSANLTSGKGGRGATYTDADFVRAIRYGLHSDGTPVFIMPSNAFNKLNDQDLANIIAYVRTVPPVDDTLPKLAFRPISRALTAFNAPGILPVSEIDLTKRPTSAPAGATEEYGATLSMGCKECHGENLTGSAQSGAPSINRSGPVGQWTEAQLITAITTGVTPEGKHLDKEKMPWDKYASLTGDDRHAIWLYLQTVPVAEPAKAK